MKKIIITGGLGYIGSELCKIYSGYSWNDKVVVIDNRFISERVNQLRKWNMEFVHGDILDKDLIEFNQIVIPPPLSEVHVHQPLFGVMTTKGLRDWSLPSILV